MHEENIEKGMKAAVRGEEDGRCGGDTQYS